MAAMLATDAGALLARDFIKRWEGCRLDAYLDAVGVWTIGYGSTRGVHPGDRITPEEADARLLEDMSSMVRAVDRETKGVALRPQERAALISLCFNIGPGEFSRSTALRLLREGDRAGAADAILMFNKGRIGGQLREIRGLTNRRLAERALFLGERNGNSDQEARRAAPDADQGGRSAAARDAVADQQEAHGDWVRDLLRALYRWIDRVRRGQ